MFNKIMRKTRAINPLYIQILFVVLLFVLIVSLSIYFMNRMVHRHMVQEVNAALDYTQMNISADLLEPQLTLGSIAEIIHTIIVMFGDAGMVEGYMHKMTGYLSADKRVMPYSAGIYGYFDVFDGMFINYFGWEPPDDYNPVESPWFKAAIEANGEIGITDPYFIEPLGKIGISYARRIFDDKGNPLGVICLDILFDRIKGYAVSTYHSGGGYGILLDREFKVIAHPSSMYLGRSLSVLNNGIAIKNELMEKGEIFERKVTDYMGKNAITFIRKLENGWYMCIVTSTDNYFRDTRNITLFLIGLGILFASVLIAVSISIDKAKQKSDVRSQQKSNFLAKMSHEIRTPMNAILGITEIQLQNKELPPSTSEALGKIHNSSYLLLGIINDILDFSKIEAGKLELLPVRYDVASLIHDTIQINMMRIGSKEVKFKLEVDSFIPSELFGDELRVKQILNNLLSNAFKYTEKGEVVLSISSRYEERVKNPYALLSICVRDTGQGMSAEQVRKLFNEYTRFNMETNRKIEGTGLGMNITNYLVHMMNGKILVESKLGKGTIFTVYLPQKMVGSGPLGKELAENLQQFKYDGISRMKTANITREPMPYGSVLVVDDVETNLYVAKGLLSPYELKIETADSGHEAIEKIRSGKLYDIVFMDHMMPIMDGIEATTILRELGYTRPIVALTANAVVGQAEMFFSHGFDDFVSKPIDLRQLNNCLNKLIRDKQPPDVLEAARRKNQEKSNDSVIPHASISPELAGIFSKDAEKAVALLKKLYEKRSSFGNDDIKLYTINVHAMKSALLNIGEAELSDYAFMLETAGHEQNVAFITEETPPFLEKLSAVIKKIKPVEAEDDGENADENRDYLLKEMILFRAACMAYDKKGAKDIITNLKMIKWHNPVKKMINNLSDLLLHSDFDEAADIARDFINHE